MTTILELMQTHDWSSTLGPRENWPVELKSLFEMMLKSKFPMFLAWGDKQTLLYNDAYIEILGGKHPKAFGNTFRDIWREIWDTIGPISEKALNGESSYFENLPLSMLRNGYREQTWFTFSYSPISNDAGEVKGIFCACFETTQTVVTQQSQEFLIKFEANLREYTTTSQILSESVRYIGEYLNISQVGYFDFNPKDSTLSQRSIWNDSKLGFNNSFATSNIDLQLVKKLVKGEIGWVKQTNSQSYLTSLTPITKHNVDIGYGLAIPLNDKSQLKSILILFAHDQKEWNKEEQRFLQILLNRIWDEIQRIQGKNNLIGSEQYFKSMVDDAPFVIWVTDGAGKLTYFNNQWTKFTGQPKKMALGKGGFETVFHEDLAHVEKCFIEALENKKNYHSEFRLKRYDGEYRWVVGLGSPRFDATGEFLGFIGGMYENHDKKLAEDALQISNARFMAAIDAIQSTLWTNNDQGKMLGKQAGWEKLTGQSFEEYQNYGWAQSIHPEDAEATIQEWNKAVKEKRIFEFTHRLKGLDGEYKKYNVRAVPILNVDGNVEEWVGVHTKSD